MVLKIKKKKKNSFKKNLNDFMNGGVGADRNGFTVWLFI